MLHIGIDMHKRFSELAAVSDAGKVIGRHTFYHDDQAALIEYFQSLDRNSIATLEATRNWYWLYELIEAAGLKMKLAHPKKVRLIAEATVKTDKIDAEVLAQLERTGFLPEAYIPPREIRDRRELLRYRVALVHARTGFKDRIHALIDKLGIQHGFSDLFGAAGQKFLNQLELRPVYRDALNAYLRTIDFLDRETEQATTKIKALLKPDPRAELLMSIPGVGVLTAHLFLSEIGEISRFPSAKKLCAYAGIVPRISQSAEHCWQGSITKEGNRYLRWGALEAAQKAPSKDATLHCFFTRIARKQGNKKARVAVGRKILVATFHVLTCNEPYQAGRLTKLSPGKPEVDAGRS